MDPKQRNQNKTTPRRHHSDLGPRQRPQNTPAEVSAVPAFHSSRARAKRGKLWIQK
ncbi:hypothetical protein BC567DRAFT_221997 [Phyllosticta citribraziliensis]